jgi:hypothetical protein
MLRVGFSLNIGSISYIVFVTNESLLSERGVLNSKYKETRSFKVNVPSTINDSTRLDYDPNH